MSAGYNMAHLLQGVCPECGQPTEKPERLEIGRLVMNRAALTVSVDGKFLPQLTPMEFDILWKIASKHGRIMPFWFLEDDGVHEHDGSTIRVVVSHIRKKFADLLKIETVRGEGYRLAI